MTPTWTGKAGEPVPAMLRHTLRVIYTEAPGGVALWGCGGCDTSGFMAAGVDPDWLPTTLCTGAVAQRLAELEAREASITEAVARSRRGTVRWLAAMADEGGDPWLSYCADAVARGLDAEWCDADHKIPPAREDTP